MSASALCKSVRDHIQALLDLDADSCEVMLTGRPKPGCGELFIAVHAGAWRTVVRGDIGRGESFGCRVTLTRRLGYVPMDRWGTEVWAKEAEGVDAILRRIMNEVAGDTTGSLDTQSRYKVIQDANEKYLSIAATDPPSWDGGFQMPLYFIDGGIPELKGPDWFTAPPALGEEGEQVEIGMAQTMVFDGAERYQIINLAT